MKTVISEHDGLLFTRFEDDHVVFEVSFEELEATDVTLRFYRDGEKVASVFNDDGTERTMVRLTTNREGTDFLGVEVPKEFVAEVIDAAVETGRVRDETAVEGYRLRVF